MELFWQKLLGKIEFHKFAILLAFLSGLILIAPSLMSVRDLGNNYEGVPFLYQDNEVFYASRVREVMDGNLYLNSPMLHEYKDFPAPLSPFGEYLYAVISVVSGVEITKVMVLSKFLFPFIFYLLIYIFSYNLFRQSISLPRLTAIAVSSTSVLGFDLISSSALSYLLNAGSDHTYLSIWTRLVNPITGGIYLFTFLIFLQKTFRSNRLLWLPTGILLGLMTGYFFSFMLGLILVFYWILFFWIKKDYSQFKKLFSALIVGAIVNVHTFNYFLFLKSDGGDNVSPFRSGLLETHSLLINKILLLSTVVFAIVFYFAIKRIEDKNDNSISLRTWSLGLIVSSFIAMNMQVLIGYAIWPQHFIQYTNIFSVIILLSCFNYIFQQKFIFARIVVLILIICTSFGFAFKTVNSYVHSMNSYNNQQRYAPIMNWLNNNADKSCSVLVNEKRDKLAPFITIMTLCNTYHTSYVSVGLPIDRVMHNYFVLLRMEGISAQDIDDYLNNNEIEIYHEYFFRDWKDMFFESRDPWLISISNRNEIEKWIDETKAQVSSSYKEFLKNDFYSELKKYRIDYVMWDEASGSRNPTESMPFIKEVYSNSGIHIYEFTK